MHWAELINHLNNKILFHHSNNAGTPLHEDRTRKWLDSTATLSRGMLPYFFVAGHHHYARYISWHLRDMQHIQPNAKQDLLNGSHVCRHIDRAAAAVSGDQYVEHQYVEHVRMSISHRGNKPGDWRAYRPAMNKSPPGTSRSVFVLTLQWQWTKKATKYGN